MSITLKNEQEQFIQKKLNSGKYGSADEVIFEAFRLLEERDKHYEQWLQDTRNKVADGLAQLDRGEGLDGESVVSNYQNLQNQKQDPAFLLKQSGFIGCADGDPNLSTNYKKTLKTILNRKYDHR
jgi:antitoxin ParD1/3/4